MRDVAIISYAADVRVDETLNQSEVELTNPVIRSALSQSGLEMKDIGITISGASDYIAGSSFSFLYVLDAVGPRPSAAWSHVESDAAWALYEAWVRLQSGDLDTALVFGFTTASTGDISQVLRLQLDPYYVAPLGISPDGVAALQARALLDAGIASERDFAWVAAQNRAHALGISDGVTDAIVDDLLQESPVVSPLRPHACPRIADGAAAVVLAAGDVARSLSDHPVWIRAMDHRIESSVLGVRDLTRSMSTAQALHHSGALAQPPDIVELHAPYAPQEIILRRELNLDDAVSVVNPSGGALVADPVIVSGLVRAGEAARRLMSGDAHRGIAHASCGPCLQQNLVCVLEAD